MIELVYYDMHTPTPSYWCNIVTENSTLSTGLGYRSPIINSTLSTGLGYRSPIINEEDKIKVQSKGGD